MPQYTTIPIDRLVSDVPVDAVHVRELADSIKTAGQLAPIIVREGSREVIDGFHRIAALKELGFTQVQCVETACDDEGFWDFRIISASLHKAVTFARAIDWMERVFELSPWQPRYKNAHMLFQSAAETKSAPKEVQAWAGLKAATWGLAPSTIAGWLETKENLTPDLIQEARQGGVAPLTHYREVAHSLPTRPELQKPLMDKAAREDLSTPQIRSVAQALRGATDAGEARTILEQPVGRTADDLTRAAKVEQLLKEPAAERSPREQQRVLTGLALEVYLDLQQQVHNVSRLTAEAIDALTPDQRAEMSQVVTALITELHGLESLLGRSSAGERVLNA